MITLEPSMEIYDIIVTVFYAVLIYCIAFVIRSFYADNLLYRKYFIKGLTAKLVGGFCFSLVYTYFYTYGGDTMAYYEDAETFTVMFFNDPNRMLSLFFNPTGDATAVLDIKNRLRFGIDTNEFSVVRFAIVTNILALNSYYSATLLFAALSYIGVWQFYLVFARRYPRIYKQLAIAVLFIPSVFFWGSGIMKDSIVLGFLGVCVYAIDRFLRDGFSKWFWLGVTFLSGAIIFSIKAYIIMALAPALLVWVVMNGKDRIRNKFLRSLVIPVLLIFSVVGIAATLQLLSLYNSRYSLERFAETAQSVQTWHYVEGENFSDNHGRGSSYTLGDYDPDLAGIIKMFPASVNVTLFRPYFWEVKNIMMVASALESFVIMIFTLYIFLVLGVRRVIPLLLKDSFLMMAFSFAIFFAFAVGFTSYNFGALARYKIPCIPFYIASLMILRDKVMEIKQNRMERQRTIMKKSNKSMQLAAQ